MVGKNIFRPKSIRAIVVLLSFILAKSAAFLGPFWIAKNATLELYGTIELYLSLGVWLAMFAGLGVPGAIPVQIINNNNLGMNHLTACLLFLSSIIVTSFVIAIHALELDPVVTMMLVIAYLSLVQQFISPLLKSQRVSPLSPWVDNLALHAVTFSCLIFYFCSAKNLNNDVFSLFFFLNFGVFFLTFLWVLFIKPGRYELLTSYKSSVQLGIPILLNGLVMMSIFNGGRPLIGFFYDEAAVALYSYFFRIAGVGLIAYQFFSILFFKNLYSSSSAEIRRKTTLLFGLIATESLITYLILDWWGDAYIPAAIYSERGVLFPIVLLQVNLWILSSILETRINSRGVTKRSAQFCLIPALILLVAFWVIEFLDLSSIVAACLCLSWVALITILVQLFVVNFKSRDPLDFKAPIALACFPLVFLFGAYL